MNRRKESQTRRQTQEEAADAFIQTNFQPSEDVEQQQQQPDDNQNKAADRYIRVGRVSCQLIIIGLPPLLDYRPRHPPPHHLYQRVTEPSPSSAHET